VVFTCDVHGDRKIVMQFNPPAGSQGNQIPDPNRLRCVDCLEEVDPGADQERCLMAANTNPIFGRTPDVQVGGAVLGPTANTLQDGTGANTRSIFMADTTEGGFVDEIRLKPVGSPAATVCACFSAR
jgi:hypothetical protein